ncbi:hypothetical protein CBA19CS91_01845 [Paraburkholderia hospita]|nr:hypothetical protein CBA19CS91_01845 [Paraburkholderia hospita]
MNAGSDIGDYVKSTFSEIGHHPWQALGAAFGVPGFDPAIGGTFNNHKGGALISPTGNFTSSAWDEMYQNNPDATQGLNAFHKVNSVADVIAPLIAGGYASGAFGAGGSAGSAGGAGGLTGFLDGPAAYGDSGLTGTVSANGSGLGSAMGGDLGGALGDAPSGLFSGLLPGGGMTGTSSGALGGGLSGETAGLSGIGGASMGGYGGLLSNLLNQGQQQLQQQQNTQQRQNTGWQPQNGARAPYRGGGQGVSFLPQSAITLPYTLSSGNTDSLLQQILRAAQTNPSTMGQG